MILAVPHSGGKPIPVASINKLLLPLMGFQASSAPKANTMRTVGKGVSVEARKCVQLASRSDTLTRGSVSPTPVCGSYAVQLQPGGLLPALCGLPGGLPGGGLLGGLPGGGLGVGPNFQGPIVPGGHAAVGDI